MSADDDLSRTVEQHPEAVEETALSYAGVLETAKRLVPLDQGAASANQGESKTMEAILDERLQSSGCQLETPELPGLDSRSRFALACLRCVNDFQTSLVREQDRPGWPGLGLKDARVITAMLEIVVYWGIAPCLLPGVGVPVSKRSRTSLDKIEGSLPKRGESETKNVQSEALLYNIVHGLSSLISSEISFVVVTLTSRYLADIYAALLQIAYAPIPASTLVDTVGTGTRPDAAFTGDNAPALTSQEREESKRLFESIYSSVLIQYNPFLHIYLRWKSVDSVLSLRALMSLFGSPSQPAPPWLRRLCGRLMSQILLRPTGVSALFNCLLEGEGDDEPPNINKLEQIARLILSVPAQTASPEQYFSIICPQIIELLHAPKKLSAFSRAAAFLTTRFMMTQPALAQQHLVGELTLPLLSFYVADKSNAPPSDRNETDLDGNRILANEGDVTTSVRDVQTLLVANEPNPSIMTSLTKVIPPLYFIYDFATQSGSHLKSELFDVLQTFFRLADTEDGLIVLRRIAVDLPKDRTAKVSAGESGGVVLALPSDDFRIPLDANRFADFLKQVNNEPLTGEFFLQLLEYHATAKHNDSDEHFVIGALTPLILAIMDRFGESIVKKPGQIISFVKNMLLDGDPESMSMAMGLLAATFSNDTVTIERKHRPVLDEILIILQTLTLSEDEELRQIARDLRTLIVIKGPAGSRSDGGDTARAKSEETIREAFKELVDPLLPVRAHGMSLLRNLVLQRDPVAAERLDDITSLYLDQIEDADSFIYLNAVKGLSALTDAYPQKALSKIANRYQDDKFRMDYRLRIGEALLQTIQRCGEVFGKYAPQILPPVLKVMHDPAKELRSSALSLIACVGETAPLSLLPFLYQIMDYIRNLLQIEKTVETRRGAIVNFLSLIRGLGDSLLQTLPTDILRDMYRQLRIVESTDPDELTRMHARVALADLKTVLTNFVSPS
ncbi:transmembrane and coiled-coil domains-containing protein 7 [Borealophlyctis nickersoniae]|nr:transmembrane and coiled-coil domains-containing protein 7 [Borealophlyctis nickersoniae]